MSPSAPSRTDVQEPASGTPEFLFGVFPLALLAGALLAPLHVWAADLMDRTAGTDARVVGYRTFALVERWPEVLVEAVVAGLVGALALVFTVGRRAGPLPSLAGFALAFVASAAFLTGLPAGPFDHPPGLGPLTLGGALGTALLLLILARMRFGGRLALVLGVLAAAGAVFGGRALVARVEPGLPVREIVLDLAAEPARLTAVHARPDAPVTHGTLTPAIDQQTDTADKPSIVLPPPASVEFVVPPEADGTRFVAAAGADIDTVHAFPDGLDVVYRVVVDGKTRWEETVEHRPEIVGPRRFDTAAMQWRHIADGDAEERGIVVRGGQRIRLETDFAPGVDPERFGADLPRVGFGGPALVREGRIPRAIPTAAQPNVVVIVMDTQRLDRLGCYGYERPVSPNVDALAARGLVFDDAYTTSSWTWPSTASLMTGLPPDAHGVRSPEACTLSQNFVTVAEALQREGYTTAAFSGNPIVEPSRGFDQGFETFVAERGVRFVKSDEIVPEVLEWIDDHEDLRFFLYLQLVDPHTPHSPHPDEAARLELGPPPADWPENGLNGVPYDRLPSPETRQYANDLYDASVATGDRWVGEIVARLRQHGIEDDTLIVFTSDHGEELFDHGSHGHGHDVWAELVRAPLILAGPGVPAGQRRAGVVSNRYLATTLAARCGADLEVYGTPCDLLEGAMPGDAWFQTSKGRWGTLPYQEIQGLRRGAYTAHWHVTDTLPSEAARANLRIFDVLARPDQSADLIAVRSEEAREMAQSMLELQRQAAELRPSVIAGAGADGRETLRGIGYTPDGDDED